ncbi:MAG: cation transporter [Clostridia bacterium]|nr:cation transporter [Clostridia bacterium]
MKVVFETEDLDCAHCAQKMEDAVAKIDGVQFCKVNFLALKMTLEIQDDKEDEIIKKVIATCKKVEPDCTLRRK